MTANWNRCSAPHSMLAPRSRTTTGRAAAGITEAMAGRSMPGSVFSTILAMAISAPVLPAETAAAASPSLTALMARRMLVLRPWRSAVEGLASPATASGVCRTAALCRSCGWLASSGSSRCASPNRRNARSGCLLERQGCTLDDDSRCRIPAHGVERDGEAHGQRNPVVVVMAGERVIGTGIITIYGQCLRQAASASNGPPAVAAFGASCASRRSASGDRG